MQQGPDEPELTTRATRIISAAVQRSPMVATTVWCVSQAVVTAGTKVPSTKDQPAITQKQAAKMANVSVGTVKRGMTVG